ncbi:transposase DNA-binding-containing protein [Mesorhizobium sp. WSM3224]|uniref:IS4/Tn5 family transposase DNA-binding protein n=1 Tax=Mesorhizobium sp. WSM3224 TaxID=1040986 RepID=UPI001FDA9BE0|nr:transposase DNA-binding-containing protein [Mesorhizobium sp. WSM3224]
MTKARPQNWMDEEIAEGQLPDKRLDKRLRQVFDQLGGAMGQTIPRACQDWANTKAAYRFFSNGRVNEHAILKGHFDATRDRVADAEGPILSPAGHDRVYVSAGENRGDRHHQGHQQRQGQGGPTAPTHRVRIADAFELGGNDARSSPRADCGEVLDPR